jgi:hypothetical protein
MAQKYSEDVDQFVKVLGLRALVFGREVKSFDSHEL